MNKMSKRCELQKKYYKKYGNYKGEGKYSDHYVKWLEDIVICNVPDDQQSDKTIEERAKELYPELSSKEETYLRNNVDMQIQREAYIKGATDNQNK